MNEWISFPNHFQLYFIPCFDFRTVQTAKDVVKLCVSLVKELARYCMMETLPNFFSEISGVFLQLIFTFDSKRKRTVFYLNYMNNVFAGNHRKWEFSHALVLLWVSQKHLVFHSQNRILSHWSDTVGSSYATCPAWREWNPEQEHSLEDTLQHLVAGTLVAFFL